MKHSEDDQNHKKESTPAVDNKPHGKSLIIYEKKHIFHRPDFDITDDGFIGA